MKKYRFTLNNIDKFLHQNQAEIIELVEGSLIDNYLIVTKRGYMALIEKYVNCWTSEHILYFSTKEEDIEAIWNDNVAQYIESGTFY